MIDKRLLRETRQVRHLWALSAGLGLAAGLLAVVQAGCLARVVDRVFLTGQGLDGVRFWLGAILVLVLARTALVWVGDLAAHRMAARIKKALRRRLLDHLLAVGPAYTQGERAGELASVVVAGVDAVEAYFARYLPQLATAALVPLAILGFVFPVDPLTGVLLLLTAPVIPLLMVLIGRWAEALTRRQWETLSRMSAHFLDVLQGLTTLKIFGRSKAQAEVIALISERFRGTSLGVLRVAFLSALTLELLATISTALVAVTVGLRLLNGGMPFAQAFFLLLLAPEFYQPLRLLGSHFHAGLAGVTAAARIFTILGAELPERREQSCRHLPPVHTVHLVLHDVYYAYANGSRPALRGFTAELRPGEKVALVGPSGAGKTTVANLLLRFMEPDRGSIQVNGLPLEQISVAAWRRLVAFVPQDPYLFYGSIADNIRLANPEASEEEVQAAAKLANAHDFILELPGGYHTPVGEGGLRLSAGQAQRLAIARAFLKDAPLVIVDELTESLDPLNEKAVREALVQLMRGRTVLLIAHRLGTATMADRILVLVDGQVVEAGRHEELLARSGVYRRLFNALGGAA